MLNLEFQSFFRVEDAENLPDLPIKTATICNDDTDAIITLAIEDKLENLNV